MDKTLKPVSEFINNPFRDSTSKKNQTPFPLRACVNIFLIFLSTIQVFILSHSHIYIRASLVRSFLSIYYDDDSYPELFAGNAYSVSMLQVKQVKDHLEFAFSNIRQSQTHTFLNCSFDGSKFMLRIQYNIESKQKKGEYLIDPAVGIVKPFDMRNISSIQHFLMRINYFAIDITNITTNIEGFIETYRHSINYEYKNDVQLLNTFEFQVDDGLITDTLINQPQFSYILYIRLLNLTVLVMALLGLWLNYKIIRKTYRYFYEAIGYNQRTNLMEESETDLQEAIYRWVDHNRISIQELSFLHYYHVIEFDIIFSSLSNVFQVVGSFYLVTGSERERIVGIGCLFSWLTIFKFLRGQKKLILMYELLKMSFVGLVFFFVEFLPVFISYSLLGMCIFHKSPFFADLQNSVTTLVSLMLGDSIDMITQAIILKYSTTAAILYIFSFVLLFMHAIHNTLTSLIKEAFIIKKIELVTYEKERNQDSHYIYLDEFKTDTEALKEKLPIKLSEKVTHELIRNHLNRQSKGFRRRIQSLVTHWDHILMAEKWVVLDHQIHRNAHYFRELKRRLKGISSFLHPRLNQSIITDQSSFSQ